MHALRSRLWGASTRNTFRSALQNHARASMGMSLRPCGSRQAFRSSSIIQAAGSVDRELGAKLQSELKMEMEMQKEMPHEMPPSVKDYLENGAFKVIDKSGQCEVELIREFGNEQVKILFSISDIEDMENRFAEDDEEYEDSKDIAEAQSGGAQSKQAKVDGSPELQQDDDEHSFPVRCNITVSKSEGGALTFDAIAQDGVFVIDNIYFYKTAELATAATAEADWERRGLYMGPSFHNLDEDLQVIFEKYLEERGINTALALFVPDYVDYKEQKEYVAWLNGVKAFVDS